MLLAITDVLYRPTDAYLECGFTRFADQVPHSHLPIITTAVQLHLLGVKQQPEHHAAAGQAKQAERTLCSEAQQRLTHTCGR